MKSLVVFLCALAAVSAVSSDALVKEQWKAFKLEYNKQYDSEIEEHFRMKIYAENLNFIAKHNQRFEQGLVSYKLAQNEYGDMLHHEFVKAFNGFNETTKKDEEQEGATFLPPAHVLFPNQVDWRLHGAVTEVKNQGQCGSCWAFSSTGALEGQYFRKTGYLVSLSEQNLVDCTIAYGNQGCQGGWMNNAFKYIRDNRGIDTEKSYPYEAVRGYCRYNWKNSGAYDVGFVNIPRGSERMLLAAVATAGPVAVSIDGTQRSFQFYSTGVYYDVHCSSVRQNHAVLVVGYGTETGGPYWLVKNSWGTTWGDKGYIKMARNRFNHCGIANFASYPAV